MKSLIKRILNEIASVNRLILLDIDDTIVEPANISIKRKLPSDEEEIILSPKEYAKEKVTPSKVKYYDYDEFRDPEKVKQSIIGGTPLIVNLQYMDELIKQGYKIGFLTARSQENAVFEGLKEFLMYKDPITGELVSIGDKLDRELVFAINDSGRVSELKSTTDYDKKAEVILSLLDDFDQVIFVDDDLKNVKAVKELKMGLPKDKANKLFAMPSKK